MRQPAEIARVPGRPGLSGPIRLLDVELSRPLVGIEPSAHVAARVLVRLHGHPLGSIELPLFEERLDRGSLADAVWVQFGAAIRRHCRDDGLAVPEKLGEGGLHGHPAAWPCSWRARLGLSGLPRTTVVVTTCGGAETRVLDTVRQALAQTYPNFDVVVVDNRPATSGVHRLLRTNLPGERRLRYVAEREPGLAHARNRGAAVASGEIVAFTDDDVDLDPDWLGYLVAGFDDGRVACVTGLILPMELETPAQRLLEEFGGYAKGFARRAWDRDEHRADNPLYPYTVGAFGSGANAAFRVSALAHLGGFDNALGTGTPARGGEDIDIYVRCVQAGFQIVYEPAAIVRHAHLAQLDQVRHKVHDYGVGLGAMLAKHLTGRATATALLRRVPAGVVHLLSPRSPKNAARTGAYPASLVVAELEGLLYGPVAYLRSRRAP